MPIARLIALFALGLAGLGVLTFAVAQDGEEAERSAFIRFVEEQISTPDQQIRLGTIDGALSSDVTISSITVSDRDGAWLTLEGVRLVWNRLALLTGKLDVDLLEADRILLPRTSAGGVDTETPQFEVPELPVEVEVDALRVPRVEIGEAVFGRESVLSVDGTMSLIGGSLTANLAVERVDADGTFAIEARYSNESRDLDLRLALSEPEDGVIANLLNLRDRPAVDFVIAGSGPLDAFRADITLAANGEQLLGGAATISRVDTGFRFVTELDGGLDRIVSEDFSAYVDAGSRLAVDAVWRDDGGISLRTARLTSGVIELDAAGELAEDGFPVRLDLVAELNAGGGAAVPLPGLGGGATVESGRIEASLGANADDSWTAEFDLRGLKTATISSERTTLRATGQATNLADPESRVVTFEVAGLSAGLGSDDPDIADAIGSEVQLSASGSWRSGGPIELREVLVDNANLRIRFEGNVEDGRATGSYSVSADSLGLFAGLVGEPLSGSADILATGTVDLSGDSFDLQLDGRARDLDVGVPELVGLLEGTTTVTGAARRSEDGLGFRNLEIRSDTASVVVNGDWLGDRADLRLDGRIADMAAVTERAGGAVQVQASATGGAEARALEANVVGEGLTLSGRPFNDARARFTGTLAGDDLSGDVSLAGRLDEMPVTATARIAVAANGARSISGLDITAGRATASGDLVLSPEGLAEGAIRVDAPDLAAIAPLLLADASGALAADIALSAPEGRQSADISASASNLRYESFRFGSATIDVAGEDLFGVPVVDGRIEARDAAIGVVEVNTLVATATRDGDGMRYDLQADVTGGNLTGNGALSPVDGGFDLDIRSLDLTGGPIGVRLAEPARVSIRGRRIAVDGVSLSVGEGRVAVSGVVDDEIDLGAVVTGLPVSVVNAFAPGLEGRGLLSGTVEAGGTLEKPVADFVVQGRDISARPLTEFGIQRLSFDGRGRYADGTLGVEADANVGGGRVALTGSIGDRLDVRANITGMPLAIINSVEPSLELSGTASGVVTATGSLSDPDARFELEGRQVSAAPLREFGLPPVAVSARGRLAGDTIRLDGASATGGGVRVEASGDLPLDGRGLDLAIDGTLPLSLTDRHLAEFGGRLAGSVRIDMRITGSLSDPRLAGSLSADGATAIGPQAGLQLRNITLRSVLDGDTLAIQRLTGTLGQGTVSVTGTVGIRPGAGFPADLQIALRNARYTDGNLVTATMSGALTLRGALADGMILGGSITVERAEITVPESLPTTAKMLDVKHRNAPPDVIATLVRAGLLGAGGRAPAGTGYGLMLDVRIVAPARVFVRGRGLDSELGGEVTITGPLSAVRPVGSFRMRRGRIDILGQRITFDRGELTLVGDLDPVLDFVATTRGDTVTVTLTVAGRASDPEVSFSSQPELPEDEVLSQLLFGRGVSELSPLQIAQLAAAAAQLAGGGGSGILDQIRAATGFDNLDVVTDSQGRVGVEVGRYITDNVYLGVRGSEDSAGVSVNLDITDDLTARAEASQDDSEFGIFYELEY